MSDTETFWLAMLLVIFVTAMAAFLPGKGCSGDCRQGRRPCDCKKEK